MREVVIAGYLRTAQSRPRPKEPAHDWFYKLHVQEPLAKLKEHKGRPDFDESFYRID